MKKILLDPCGSTCLVCSQLAAAMSRKHLMHLIGVRSNWRASQRAHQGTQSRDEADACAALAARAAETAEPVRCM